MSSIYGLILAGGSGTRLWPLSRGHQPKHLQTLMGQESLLQSTLRRILGTIPAEKILVVTHERQKAEVESQMEVLMPPSGHLLAEPQARNTLPAVLLGVLNVSQKDPHALVCVFPSDHFIADETAFRTDLAQALTIAEDGWLVTFGIKPTAAETGFGYLQAGSPLKAGGRRVEKFLEKPDHATAEKLASQEGYYWNSGMFVFRASVFLDEIRKYQKEIYRPSPEDLLQAYASLPSLSIDHGLMEKSEKVAIVPASFGWSDLGNWEAVYQILEKNSDGNAVQGRVLAEDTHSSMLLSRHGLLATIGLKDMIVISSGDAILVCPRDRAQEVRKIGETSREQTADTAVHRPWGQYTVLEEGPGYKIKKIVVDPGHKLSLQSHRQRAEHWVVIEGTAKVVNANEEILLGKNESTFIPMGQKHRLENPGASPLVIIEVQTGNYVGEDDIERFEDIYGRPTKADR